MKEEVEKEVNEITKKYGYKSIDRIGWHKISWRENLSEDFIREFKAKVDWYWISCFQKLSKTFIRELKYKLDLDSMLRHNKISRRFYNELTVIKPLNRYEMLDFT